MWAEQINQNMCGLGMTLSCVEKLLQAGTHTWSTQPHIALSPSTVACHARGHHAYLNNDTKSGGKHKERRMHAWGYVHGLVFVLDRLGVHGRLEALLHAILPRVCTETATGGVPRWHTGFS